jgi:hypothetical protein
MRELALQLAAQGKLAERKENDGKAWTIFPEGLPPAGLSRYEGADTWIWVGYEVKEEMVMTMSDDEW